MKEKKVTDSELQAAIRRFVAEGGIIKKLPDQKAVASQMVGVRWNHTEVGGEPN